MLLFFASRQKIRLVLICFLGGVAAFAEPATSFGGTLLKFGAIERIVDQHFADNSDYDKGDIISRSQVKLLVKKLRIAGWYVSPEYGIIKSVLPDTNYLVRQLRSSAGERFMSSVSDFPIVFDRLDRLVAYAEGRQLVRGLLQGKAGEDVRRHLTAADGGKQLIKKLSRVPQDLDLDKPTGRIYTEAALIKRLAIAHEADRVKREAAKTENPQ